MNLLALETSTERLSLALACDGVFFTREIDAGQRHSELAIQAIRDLFAEAKSSPRALHGIAFGQGPGSFVGVRIACGLAQGIALGANIGLLPVPTPLALAEQAHRVRAHMQHTHDMHNVFVAIDARMNEMYVAGYQRAADGWREAIAPVLVDAATLPDIDGESWLAIGSAFDTVTLAAALRARYGAKFVDTVAGALPSARDVLSVAEVQLARGHELLAPDQAAPLYLRNNVALTIEERAQAKQLRAVA
jgi:tRNA threonylcarbamoyladenosine biosynthesis protein TsaB